MADRPDKANNRDISSQVHHIIKQIVVCQGSCGNFPSSPVLIERLHR